MFLLTYLLTYNEGSHWNLVTAVALKTKVITLTDRYYDNVYSPEYTGRVIRQRQIYTQRIETHELRTTLLTTMHILIKLGMYAINSNA